MSEKNPAIIFTDIQLHTSYNQNTKSLKRNVDKSLKSNQPGRFYLKPEYLKINEDGTFKFIIPIKDIEEYGIAVVKDMPISAGKDALEKLKSLKKK